MAIDTNEVILMKSSLTHIYDNSIRSMLIKQFAKKKYLRQIKNKTKMRTIKSEMMRILHSVDDVDVSLKEKKMVSLLTN